MSSETSAPAPSRQAEFTTYDFAQLPVRERYKLLVGFIVPRPIGLISTLSPEGIPNVAAFSSLNLVASAPPTLVFSVSRRRDGRVKDTLANIQATKEFVVNMAVEGLLNAVAICGADFEPNINEAELAGLSLQQSTAVSPPRVLESPVQFECELLQLVEVADDAGKPGTSCLVIGKIKRLHISKNVLQDDVPDYDRLQPLAKLGGLSYSTIGSIIDHKIPAPSEVLAKTQA